MLCSCFDLVIVTKIPITAFNNITEQQTLKSFLTILRLSYVFSQESMGLHKFAPLTEKSHIYNMRKDQDFYTLNSH